MKLMPTLCMQDTRPARHRYGGLTNQVDEMSSKAGGHFSLYGNGQGLRRKLGGGRGRWLTKEPTSV
jgi:hypothetical protein